MISVVMLSIITQNVLHAKCHIIYCYTECRCAESHGTQTKCRFFWLNKDKSILSKVLNLKSLDKTLKNTF
jgi:hypothetical protein